MPTPRAVAHGEARAGADGAGADAAAVAHDEAQRAPDAGAVAAAVAHGEARGPADGSADDAGADAEAVAHDAAHGPAAHGHSRRGADADADARTDRVLPHGGADARPDPAYKPTFTPTATPSGITRFVTACVVILFFFSFRLIAVVLPLMTGSGAATAEVIRPSLLLLFCARARAPRPIGSGHNLPDIAAAPRDGRADKTETNERVPRSEAALSRVARAVRAVRARRAVDAGRVGVLAELGDERVELGLAVLVPAGHDDRAARARRREPAQRAARPRELDVGQRRAVLDCARAHGRQGPTCSPASPLYSLAKHGAPMQLAPYSPASPRRASQSIVSTPSSMSEPTDHSETARVRPDLAVPDRLAQRAVVLGDVRAVRVLAQRLEVVRVLREDGARPPERERRLVVGRHAAARRSSPCRRSGRTSRRRTARAGTWHTTLSVPVALSSARTLSLASSELEDDRCSPRASAELAARPALHVGRAHVEHDEQDDGRDRRQGEHARPVRAMRGGEQRRRLHRKFDLEHDLARLGGDRGLRCRTSFSGSFVQIFIFRQRSCALFAGLFAHSQQRPFSDLL